MKIKIVSDFHTEFWGYSNPIKFEKILDRYFPVCEDDKQTILVCGGDMGTFNHYASTYKPLLALLGKRFKAVVCVPGNHSWYNSTGIWRREGNFWKDKKLPRNVYYLDNDVKVIEDVAIIGSCLWTSFDNLSPIAMLHADKGMNDFRCIIKGNEGLGGSPYGISSRLRPEDTVEKHYESVEYIRQALEIFKDKKCVVVTHHMPSSESVNSKYRGDLLNAAYYSDLDELMLLSRPLLWVHGHTHDSCDYEMGRTRVVCNPLGYHAVLTNRDFNPDLVVEV